MTLEMIVGAITALIAVVFGAFHAGKSSATAKAEKQRTEEKATATAAVAKRRIEATKGASDVQQSVNHLPDDDVDRELREKFTRSGGH